MLKHKLINLKGQFIGYGGFLTINNDRVIGMDFSPSQPPFFCLKPNETPPAFFHFGNKGQGPNDFLHPFSIQLINDSTIGSMDMSANTYMEFRIPQEGEEVEITKRMKFNFNARPLRMIKTAHNQYIGLSMQNSLFVMMDSTGNELNSFFEYPYRNKDELQLENRYRSYAYQGVLSANPTKTNYVYTPFNGEIIHFYTIENGNIKLINKIEKEYPLYKNNSDKTSTGVITSTECILGYISSYATEEFVYALFNGKKRIDQKRNDFEASILRVFDWNGTLKKEYELDIPCSHLCVSDDNSKLWAIATQPEMTLVSFNLKPQKETSNNLPELKNDYLPNNPQELVNTDTTMTTHIFLNKVPTTIEIPIESQIISSSTNSKNITIKDSILSPNKSILKIHVSETTFKDTDTVFVVTKFIPYRIIVTGKTPENMKMKL